MSARRSGYDTGPLACLSHYARTCGKAMLLSTHEASKGSYMRAVLACVLAVLVGSCGGSSSGDTWDVNAVWDVSNWE